MSPHTPQKGKRGVLGSTTPVVFLNWTLNGKVGHILNLPITANGLDAWSKSRGALIEKIGHEGVAAIGGASRGGRYRRLTSHGSWNKTQILVDIVNGNVKAGVVRQVENIEAVLQSKPLRQGRHLH